MTKGHSRPHAGVGIDFGTTNSTVAVADGQGAVRVAHFPFEGRMVDTFRSVLFFEQSSKATGRKPKPLAGPQAIERYLEGHEDSRLIQSIKSFVASRLFRETQIAGYRYALEDLVALLLQALRAAAEVELGPLGSRVVIGRPVRFVGAKQPEDEEFAVGRLLTAVKRAGFEDITFEFEPVGAAYHYESRLDHDELILIGDFGGGTSDFSLLRVGPGIRRKGRGREDILGTSGVPVAGDVFDAQIIRHVVSPLLGRGTHYQSMGKLLRVPDSLYRNLERWHYLSFLKSRETMQTLKAVRAEAEEPDKIDGLIQLVEGDFGFQLHRAVQRTKYELSTANESLFRFSDPAVSIEQRVLRADFERWIAGELKLIAECVDGLLQQASLSTGKVNRVFLTGGTSLVPAVRRLFADRFGEEALRAGDEFTSVAQGLALRAMDPKM